MYLSGLYAADYLEECQKLFTFIPSNKLYMNADSGVITADLPHLTPRPGGILADEMGLGKTVEVSGGNHQTS